MDFDLQFGTLLSFSVTIYLHHRLFSFLSDVNGGFTEWSEFSACSVTCGVGNKARERMCTNPEPKGEGLPCEGSYTETKQCHMPSCPSKYLSV